jgi:hypothetical protein
VGAPAPQAIHLSRWPGVGATSRATFEQFADFGTACFQYRNPAIARDLPVNFLCLISRSFHAIDMYIIIAYWRGAVGHEGNRVDQPTLESPKLASRARDFGCFSAAAPPVQLRGVAQGHTCWTYSVSERLEFKGEA